MHRCFRNPKYCFVWELLAGMAAQTLLLGTLLAPVVLGRESLNDLYMFRMRSDMVLVFSAIGAFLTIGPQTVFIIHQGDTRAKLFAAVCYIADGVLLIIAVLILAWFCAVINSWG